MKKAAYLILAVVWAVVMVCLPVFPSSSAWAAGISVSGASARPGDQLTLTVSVSDNTGFVNYSGSVSYDTNALQLLSIDPVGALLAGATINGDQISFASPSAVTGSGALFRLRFQVLSGASGSSSVSVTTKTMRDANGQSVAQGTASGAVTIIAAEPSAPVQDTPAPDVPIAGSATPTPKPQSSGGSSSSVPKTGDSRSVAGSVALIALGCVGILSMVFGWKDERNN